MCVTCVSYCMFDEEAHSVTRLQAYCAHTLPFMSYLTGQPITPTVFSTNSVNISPTGLHSICVCVCVVTEYTESIFGSGNDELISFMAS